MLNIPLMLELSTWWTFGMFTLRSRRLVTLGAPFGAFHEWWALLILMGLVWPLILVVCVHVLWKQHRSIAREIVTDALD